MAVKGKAPEILKYNEAKRQELLATGKRSLYFFAQGILGFKDLDKNPHFELCENLDGRGTWGDWRRGLVCASRGFLKSSICTIAWPTRQALYNVNWACRILGASYENTKMNFFDPILETFTTGPKRNFLLWLYGDRFHPGFEGCNEHQIELVKTDPLAKPAITFKGIGSDQEGWHGNAVIVDDPEGADAAKGPSGNEDAYRSLNNAVPLLINPLEGCLLLIGTPHGGNPLVWRVRDSEAGGSLENAGREWKIFWKPLVDSSGESNWPGRFTPKAIEFIRKTTDKRVFDQQFLLQKVSDSGNTFNWDAIAAGMYRWKVPYKVIEYPTMEMDALKWYGDAQRDTAGELLNPGGDFKFTIKQKTVAVEELRYYMHVDPVHKADPISQKMTGTARPSRAAVVVVGVSPDFHAFVLDCWTEQVELAEQVRHTYKGYRLFGPQAITFDPIGAQVWFKDYCEMLERSDPRFQMLDTLGIYGPKRNLPRLSSRLVEDKRPAGQPKEDTVADRLNPWFGSCTLHLHEKHDQLRIQLQGFPDNTDYVDLADALAQGPPVWKPPLGKVRQKSLLRDQMLTRQLAARHTGYLPAFSRHPPRLLSEPKTLLDP